MCEKTERFAALATKALVQQKHPPKILNVSDRGFFTATFFGEASARATALLLGPALERVAVYSGYDAKKDQSGDWRPDYVQVWRIRAWLKGSKS